MSTFHQRPSNLDIYVKDHDDERKLTL